jgi:hypothetical protein
MLDEALERIWLVIRARPVELTDEEEVELRTILAERVIALAATGVDTAEELCRRALEMLPPLPRPDSIYYAPPFPQRR